MLGDKKEVKGNENLTIQGNNNSNNTFIVNPTKAIGIDVTLNIEEDLKEIIIAFKNELKLGVSEKTNIKEDFQKLDLDEKNELNNLSKDYYESIIKEHFIYFEDIDSFLMNPYNIEEKEIFYDIVFELKKKQNLNKSKFLNFEKFLEYVGDEVLSKYSDILKRKKRFVSIFLHFMYCRCMIGEKVKSV